MYRELGVLLAGGVARRDADTGRSRLCGQGQEGRAGSPLAGMGAPGPTANVASRLQYFGTSFWPLRHHSSLGVTTGLPEQLCLQGLEMPWNGWSTGTPPATATQWHLTLWPLPTCSLHPEVLLLER